MTFKSKKIKEGWIINPECSKCGGIIYPMGGCRCKPQKGPRWLE